MGRHALRFAACHPDRKYHCKDMCSSCYDKARAEKRRGSPAYAKRLDTLRIKYATDESYRREKLAIRKKNYNPEATYRRHVTSRYGLSATAYDVLWAEQEGKCKFCGRTNSGKFRLSVDHCHKTGRVRGLLCMSCNAKLGWYENRRTQIEEYIAAACETL